MQGSRKLTDIPVNALFYNKFLPLEKYATYIYNRVFSHKKCAYNYNMMSMEKCLRCTWAAAPIHNRSS